MANMYKAADTGIWYARTGTADTGAETFQCYNATSTKTCSPYAQCLVGLLLSRVDWCAGSDVSIPLLLANSQTLIETIQPATRDEQMALLESLCMEQQQLTHPAHKGDPKKQVVTDYDKRAGIAQQFT